MAKSKLDIKSENDEKIYENSTFAVSAKDINDVNVSIVDAMAVDGENLGEDAFSHGVFAGKDVNGGTDEGVLAFKSIRVTGSASISSNSEQVTINVPQANNPATEFGLYYEPFLDVIGSHSIRGYVSRVGSSVKISGRIYSDNRDGANFFDRPPLELKAMGVIPMDFAKNEGYRWLRMKEFTCTSNGELSTDYLDSQNIFEAPNSCANGYLTMNKISSYVAGNVSDSSSRLYLAGKILGTTRSYEIDHATPFYNYSLGGNGSDVPIGQPSQLAPDDIDISANDKYMVVDRKESVVTSGGSVIEPDSGSQGAYPDYYLGSPLDLSTTGLDVGYQNQEFANIEDSNPSAGVPSQITDISFVLHFDLY